jgi:hypothetical protein
VNAAAPEVPGGQACEYCKGLRAVVSEGALTFSGRRADTRYCSNACRQGAYRDRHPSRRPGYRRQPHRRQFPLAVTAERPVSSR